MEITVSLQCHTDSNFSDRADHLATVVRRKILPTILFH